MAIIRSWSALFLSLWVVCLSPIAYAQNEPKETSKERENFEILYHEVLPPMALTSRSNESDQQDSVPAGWTWSFESFGKSFDLTLESNDRLIDKLPKRQRERVQESHELYRGKVGGIDGSWVRLTRIGNNWHGMLWDGQEVYIIDPMSVIKSAIPGVSLARSTDHGIYRLSDIRELEATSCGLSSSGLASHPLNDYGALVHELQERVTGNAAGAGLNLDMAVVADVEFSTIQQNFGTSTSAAVIARINVVDGIFSEQVGVQISLVDVQELSNNGTLTSTDALTLLQQFGAFTSSGGFSHPGVAHLFTGKNLNGGTVGIAYVGALCNSRFGIGVNEVIGGGTARALVVAHELGHNFGAPHDNESGSACASTPGNFIMNPFINGSDQFSPCSVTEMQPEINSASCITVINFDQSDLQVNIPNTTVESDIGAAFGYTVNVQNNGPNTATNATAGITVPSEVSIQNVSINTGSCASNGSGQVNCDLGNVPNGVTRTISLTLQGQIAGQFILQASALASNDNDSTNNSGEGTITIQAQPTNVPAITSPTPNSVLPGSTATFTWAPNGVMASQWWLHVGTSQGAFDLIDTGSLGTVLSHTLSGLPTDGSTVWVRLWYSNSSGWHSVDAQYTAATQNNGTTPAIQSPTPGSELPGSTVTINWTANGVSVREWWLHVGTSQGAFDLIDTGSLGTVLSHTLSGLPTDGSTVWVRLWYSDSSGWHSVDAQYTAATQNNGTTPAIQSPTPGSELPGSTVTINWTANGVSVREWWLHVGTSQGAFDLVDTGSLGTVLSHTLSGLPTDGSTVWVRLWYSDSSGWHSVDAQYTAATQ